MKTIKKTADYTIYQKKSARYAVKNADKKWVNGDDKLKILIAEKLLKVAAPKAKPAAEAEPEAPAAESTAEPAAEPAAE